MLNQEAAMPWNQADNTLTASFWGCCPTDALWKFKTCHSPALVSLIFHSSCTNSPARTPNPDQRLPSDVPVTLLNVFTPRGPLLFPQCLCLARLNTSDLSLRTSSTYVDTSSHAESLLFLWIQILYWRGSGRVTAHDAISPGILWTLTHIWTELDNQTRLIHPHQASHSAQASGEIPRACSGLCNPTIRICSPTTRPSRQPRLLVHGSAGRREPIYVNLSCSTERPNLPVITASLKTPFS